MDAIRDPATLREEPDVEYSETRTTDGQDAFDYFDGIAGLVAIGITNDEGAVLLMDSPHGWRLPYGHVDAGSDWLARTEEIGEMLTGVPVRAAEVLRVSEITHELRTDADQTATSFDAVVGTDPVDGEPLAHDPTFGEWETLELDWFDEVPEDAYHTHADAVDDIEYFLE
ncbi:hypothetical protein ACFQMA_20510 [Halosimplex aquaticum]|uniref:Nudix hydrolase domain-containing protein n=1 Tax=Halosimplex aquaticum TaxID=3026162 RepID=A0ABD5Y4P8_9EURY|nr:hypothetical protein [Halosimplex aquaticum]